MTYLESMVPEIPLGEREEREVVPRAAVEPLRFAVRGTTLRHAVVAGVLFAVCGALWGGFLAAVA